MRLLISSRTSCVRPTARRSRSWRTGADVERIVLARAVQWHLEDRVLVDGNKTIVF